MSEGLPVVYLARHGETAWSLSGQHTGLKDLPLTERGERNARRLGERLKELSLKRSSPAHRSVRGGLASCQALAPRPRSSATWSEWNYGEYEGLRPDQIHADRPDWELFRDGCPGGESPHQVGILAERVVQRIRAIHGDVLIFSSGHILRVLTARWLGLEPAAGKYLVLSTASLSALS
jgi:broad specificity phosphatase PhoE